MAAFPGDRMPQWRKTFFALVILFTSGCRGWGGGTDTVEILIEKPSPDGRFIATSFYCEGGGAAGYCYWNADLRRAEDELNQRDGLLGKYKTWKGFGDIKLRWIDNGNLEIAYKQANSEAYRDHVSERVESRHGIRIHYIVTN